MTGSSMTFTGGGSISNAGETITVTINGVAYAYTTVAGDVGSWTGGSAATNLVAALGAIPGFAALYVASRVIVNQVPVTIAALAPGNSLQSFAAVYAGAGTLSFQLGAWGVAPSPVLPNMAGGDGGASATLANNCTGAGVMVGGFISQIGTTYIRSSQG